MAISNTKNNYLTKLFGSASDKFRYRKQQEEQAQPLPGQGVIPKPAGNFSLGSPARNPTIPQVGNPTIPSAGSVPASTTPQPPAGAGMPGAEGAEAKSTRYNLLQMMEPEPTRDTESEDIIKKRARMNAFGRGISALGGLAGMATGGDAVAIADLQTPYNMQQMQTLDVDYRNKLQDWTSRKFQTDAANVAIQNREVDQTIDQENKLDEINLRSEEAKALAEQRAQAALNTLQAKSEAEQIAEMEKMGIDPYGENAYGQYLDKTRQFSNANLSKIKAQTNASNRIASASTGKGTGKVSVGGKEVDYSLAEQKKGKDLMIKDLEDQKKAIAASKGKSGGMLMPQDQAEINAINDRIEAIQKYNPGSNEMSDYEIQQRFTQSLGGEVAGQPQGGAAVPFDPNKGFTNTPISKDPVVIMKAKQTLQTMVPQFKESAKTGDFTGSDAIAQALVDSGQAPSLEEAEQMLYDILYGEDEEEL